MKKLFFFLSLALAVIATGCKDNQKSQPVEVPKVPVEEKNSGEDNIVYQYYQKTKNLCGQTTQEVADYLTGKDMQFEQATPVVFFFNKEDHSVEINFSDPDENDTVDILTVTISPSEAEKHKLVFDYDYVMQLAKAVGKSDKLFNTGVECRYYGFYSQAGALLGSKGDFEAFVSGKWVTPENMNSGMAYWLDSSISEYIPNNVEKPQLFTGMYIRPVQIQRGGQQIDEYKIIMSFVIKQVIDGKK